MIHKEKKNSRVALFLSIAFHVIVALIALFFVGCWKAPGPPWPNPEVGFEVDFGTDDSGSGDVKTENEPSENEETESENTETEEQEVEETETTTDVEEVTEPVETVTETTEDTPETPAETVEPTTENTEVAPIVENSDTPVNDNTQTETVEPVEEVTPETENTPVETTPVAPTESDNSSSNSGGNNNGDDIDAVGDKGVEDSPKAIDKYEGEKSGSGEQGAALSITGWMWEKPPTEEKITKQGQITFEFVVDEYGSVVSHEIISSTYLPEQNALLVKKLYLVRFRQTSSGRPPEFTKGRLVWKFKAKQN